MFAQTGGGSLQKVNVAVYVALEAKPGKEEAVAEFLRQGKALAEAEPATIAWFGVRLGPSAEVLQGGIEASDFVEIDLDAPRIVMITCDDIDRFIPFIIERTQVDLGRLKVSTDRRDSETMPVYFKSRFMPADDPGRDRQLAFDATMASTGLFVPGAPDPLWATVKAFLANLVSDIGWRVRL